MGESIRVRVCVAIVEEGRVLLVPHYDTDAAPVQWCLPGGGLQFGESLREAVARECEEETGLEAEVGELLDVTEVILPERPWHSITITFSGKATGGALSAEAGHRYGEKTPRWVTPEEARTLSCHPKATVERVAAVLAPLPDGQP